MSIDEHKDVEGGLSELEKPFIHGEESIEGGSISMVLLSTCVAVCGSFEFGSCVSSGSVSFFIKFNLIKCFVIYFLFDEAKFFRSKKKACINKFVSLFFWLSCFVVQDHQNHQICKKKMDQNPKKEKKKKV